MKISLSPDAVKCESSKDDKFEPERSYEVNFQIHRCLTSYIEPDDYIVDISGKIICNYEPSGDSIAGTIQGYITLQLHKNSGQEPYSSRCRPSLVDSGYSSPKVKSSGK